MRFSFNEAGTHGRAAKGEHAFHVIKLGRDAWRAVMIDRNGRHALGLHPSAMWAKLECEDYAAATGARA